MDWKTQESKFSLLYNVYPSREASFHGAKQLAREADHTSASNAECQECYIIIRNMFPWHI